MKRKEAIEVIKKNYPHVNESGSQFETALRILIPEFAESEDERIRKELVEFFTFEHWDGEAPFSAESAKERIAWLEKQGEQKPTDKVEPKKEDTSELTPFEAELFSMMSDAWQGYQLGEEVNIAEIVKEHSSELLERANKQKHTWSKEDEEILNLIIARLHSHPSVEAEEYGKDYHWFKSLKDRVQPQPKQEWSEEDEKKRKCLIKGLEDRMGFGWASDPFSREEYIDWLKSLRLQSHWKPSHEQMKILNEVLNFAANHESHHWNDYIFGTLNNLVRQLKKLREE